MIDHRAPSKGRGAPTHDQTQTETAVQLTETHDRAGTALVLQGAQEMNQLTSILVDRFGSE